MGGRADRAQLPEDVQPGPLGPVFQSAVGVVRRVHELGQPSLPCPRDTQRVLGVGVRDGGEALLAGDLRDHDSGPAEERVRPVRHKPAAPFDGLGQPDGPEAPAGSGRRQGIGQGSRGPGPDANVNPLALPLPGLPVGRRHLLPGGKTNELGQLGEQRRTGFRGLPEDVDLQGAAVQCACQRRPPLQSQLGVADARNASGAGTGQQGGCVAPGDAREVGNPGQQGAQPFLDPGVQIRPLPWHQPGSDLVRADRRVVDDAGGHVPGTVDPAFGVGEERLGSGIVAHDVQLGHERCGAVPAPGQFLRPPVVAQRVHHQPVAPVRPFRPRQWSVEQDGRTAELVGAYVQSGGPPTYLGGRMDAEPRGEWHGVDGDGEAGRVVPGLPSALVSLRRPGDKSRAVTRALDASQCGPCLPPKREGAWDAILAPSGPLPRLAKAYESTR